MDFGHGEHLSLNILKLSKSILEKESPLQFDKSSPFKRAVNEVPTQMTSPTSIKAKPLDIAKMNPVSSIKEAEAKESNSPHAIAYASLTRRFTPVQQEQIERIAQEQ